MVGAAHPHNTEALPMQQEGLTNEDLTKSEAQRKEEERQEGGVADESQRSAAQGTDSGCSLFEETLLVFETQGPKVEWYTKDVAAIRNAIQSYHAIYDEREKTYSPDITGWFYQVLCATDRAASSREREPVPSASGVSETAACPVSYS